MRECKTELKKPTTREMKLWLLMPRHESTRVRWETTMKTSVWVYNNNPEHQHHNTTQYTVLHNTTPNRIVPQPPHHTAHTNADTSVRKFVRTHTNTSHHITHTPHKNRDKHTHKSTHSCERTLTRPKHTRGWKEELSKGRGWKQLHPTRNRRTRDF